MRLVFLSFANKSYEAKTGSLKRVKREAEKLGVFDEIILMNENSFDIDYSEYYKSRVDERGFGYWEWKSYVIKRILETLNDNDILFYMDSGCHINRKGMTRFKAYIETVKNSESGILVFEQELFEKYWTKGDLFKYFGILNPNAYERKQIAATCLFIRKTDISVNFVNEWFFICHNCHDMISDEKSVFPNAEGFIENRHDQSAMSMLLANKYFVKPLSAGEIWVNKNWYLLKENPIWAVRHNLFDAKKHYVYYCFKCKIKYFFKKGFNIND